MESLIMWKLPEHHLVGLIASVALEMDLHMLPISAIMVYAINTHHKYTYHTLPNAIFPADELGHLTHIVDMIKRRTRKLSSNVFRRRTLCIIYMMLFVVLYEFVRDNQNMWEKCTPKI
jgi:hypothetical protein